jgi:hypothetical protein
MRAMRAGPTSVVVCLLLWTGAARGQADAEVRALTGARTRVVWCQDQAPDGPGNDPEGVGDNHRLVGLDTDDGLGEREILSTVSGYTKPLITDDGGRVVFSNRVNNRVYIVDWDGTNLTEVTSGFASDVWRDPATGIDWIYVRTGDGGPANSIWRFDADDPATSEVVWDQTDVGYVRQVWFQVSGDGTRAAGTFPWSDCGVAVLPNVSWDRYGEGCWTNIAPDTSYRFFHFSTTHYSVDLYDPPGVNMRTIDLRGAPGIDGYDIYFPRWSNHVRFLTMAGPMTSGPDWGGTTVEVYLGRFDPDLTGVEAWVQVSRNDRADYWGDAWIAPPDPVLVVRPAQITADTMMGASDPPGQTVTVSNGGGGTLDPVSTTVTPAAASSWLTVAPGGSGNDQSLVNSFSVGALAPGLHEATVEVACANAVNTPVSYAVHLSVRAELKLNCGDNAYDVAGWERDDAFVAGGGDYVFSQPIDTSGVDDAAPAEVYRSCRASAHAYDFPFVPDGDYLVRLHFTDGYEPDGRAMDWTIEGIPVLEGFSVQQEAGLFRSLVKIFPVTVSGADGLQIAGDPGAGNDVFVSGIEVVPGSDQEDPTVAITSPVDGATVSGTVTVSGTAGDNLGLESVEIQVDSLAFEPVTGQESWSHALDTTVLADGAHTLTARATDTFDNQASHAINLFVDNAGPGDPSISILSPAGGEVWTSGSQEHIRWTTENLDDATLHYSTDDGAHWTEIAFKVDTRDPEWGDYPWTVPDDPSPDCRILVKGYFDESPTRSARFEIRSQESGDAGTTTSIGGSCGCAAGHAGIGLVWLLSLAGLARLRSREMTPGN